MNEIFFFFLQFHQPQQLEVSACHSVQIGLTTAKMEEPVLTQSMEYLVPVRRIIMELLAKIITIIARVHHVKIVELVPRHKMDTPVLAQQITMEQVARIITIRVPVHHAKIVEPAQQH